MTAQAPEYSALERFCTALAGMGFTGSIDRSLGARTVYATDNSIYEVLPQAVVFPRLPDELNQIARAASAAGIAITPRGGGTGTNGQSLTDAIAVDCARYLTRIEELNAAEGYAIVQPGVILDQLNAAAAEHGLFFAPAVSTASRATLGGMAATDASGKGSRIYGRTSDHVLRMDTVLPCGTDFSAAPLPAADIGAACARTGPAGAIYRAAAQVQRREAEEIARVFPVMNRGLTGYNLKEMSAADGGLNLIKLLCGSEGTLAITKRLKLRLLSKPAARALAVATYDSMACALEDVERLIAADPAAIEFIDDKILELAQDDPVWGTISSVLSQDTARPVRGLNFIEVNAASEPQLAGKLGRLKSLASSAPAGLNGWRVVTDPPVIATLWALRSKCVGLLGRIDPSRQGTPFVEDAAVPRENLPAFVAGFREILDSHGLAYGMFGHADAGCVHVRPALDMRLPGDAARIRPVSDAVHALAREHGGLIWGEHGKGFRSEYVPEVFGPRLYAAMCRIKAGFDPGNVLNPGKIAAPDAGAAPRPLDLPAYRGTGDAKISPELSAGLHMAIRCNGNGQCFNRDFDDAMCPSYKATGDRMRSPKGRAALLRQWARMETGRKKGAASPGLTALEEQLHSSLSDCLGCKACASQCPVKVDIPQMRSRFWARYYASRRRPLRHHMLAALDSFGPVLRALPGPANAAMRLGRPLTEAIRLSDLPEISPAAPGRPEPGGGRRRVVLVQDGFLGTFDGAVLDAARRLLDHIGYDVILTPVLDSGKARHQMGDEDGFRKIAAKTLNKLKEFSRSGEALITLEPAFAAMFQEEYRKLQPGLPPVATLDTFLSREIAAGMIAPAAPQEGKFYSVFTHCTESAADPAAATRWAEIFAFFGLEAAPQTTGCCGMAGSFGHESEQQQMSRKIYGLSWADKIDAAGEGAVATGFSCRCQVKRMTGRRPDHPAEALARALLI